MFQSRQDRFDLTDARNFVATARPIRTAGGLLDFEASSHIRNPPRNAFALSPSRHPGGSSLSILALPPPSTISSGSSAATSLSTTSKTCFRHLFLPVGRALGRQHSPHKWLSCRADDQAPSAPRL